MRRTQSSSLGILVCFSSALATLAACGKSEATQPTETQTAELAIFANEINAADAIGQRLTNQVRLKGDVIYVIRSGEDGLYALPKSSPWIITCDKAGLWLQFGQESASDAALLEISNAPLSRDACHLAVPILGAKVKALLTAE